MLNQHLLYLSIIIVEWDGQVEIQM